MTDCRRKSLVATPCLVSGPTCCPTDGLTSNSRHIRTGLRLSIIHQATSAIRSRLAASPDGCLNATGKNIHHDVLSSFQRHSGSPTSFTPASPAARLSIQDGIPAHLLGGVRLRSSHYQAASALGAAPRKARPRREGVQRQPLPWDLQTPAPHFAGFPEQGKAQSTDSAR